MHFWVTFSQILFSFSARLYHDIVGWKVAFSHFLVRHYRLKRKGLLLPGTYFQHRIASEWPLPFMTNFCKCYKIIFSHFPHFISNTSTITIFGVIKFSSKLLCARIHLYRHHPGGGGEARSEENNYLILTFSHHQHHHLAPQNVIFKLPCSQQLQF